MGLSKKAEVIVTYMVDKLKDTDWDNTMIEKLYDMITKIHKEPMEGKQLIVDATIIELVGIYVDNLKEIDIGPLDK